MTLRVGMLTNYPLAIAYQSLHWSTNFETDVPSIDVLLFQLLPQYEYVPSTHLHLALLSDRPLHLVVVDRVLGLTALCTNLSGLDGGAYLLCTKKDQEFNWKTVPIAALRRHHSQSALQISGDRHLPLPSNPVA